MILFSQKSKRIALISASGVLAALVVVWLALPGILKSQAEKYIAEKTGHRLTLAQPEINLLDLSLRLRELRLVDPQGELLVGFRELLVDLSSASLGERALIFDAISLDGLDGNLVLLKNGGMNWSALIDALQSREPQLESKELLRLSIRRLRVGGAQMAFADQRVSPAFATRIEPFDLELTDVSTLPGGNGKFKLQAKFLTGAQLLWEGNLTLNPLASSGHLDLRNINLDALAPLLKSRLPILPPSGIAAGSADYKMQQTGGNLSVELSQMGWSIDSLRLQQMAGDTAPRLAVDKLALREGHFDLTSRQLVLGSIELQGNRVEVALDKSNRTPVLRLDQLAVADVKVDLARRAASVATVALKSGGISARRDAQGRIALLDLIDSFGASPAAPATEVPEPKAVAPAEAWRYQIGQVTLGDFAVTLRDESVTPTVEFGLDKVAIGIDSISENLETPLPLRVGLDVRSGGRLELEGTLTPAEAAADLKVKLSKLALKVAQPYVGRFAALDLSSGTVSAAGRARHSAKGSSYRGSFGVHDLRLNETGTQKVFLAWKLLATDSLELDPQQLSMPQLRLDGLDTQLIIDENKSTNLQRVLRKNQTAEKGQPSDAPAVQKQMQTPTADSQALVAKPAARRTPARTESPGFVVNIDSLRFRDGELDFADRSLVLPFATRIHKMRGSIVGLSSKPGAPAQVELDGTVNQYGLARVAGKVDFFKPTDFMDLKVVFRNIEMTRMTPYSATFAGRKIASGKLSLDLEYKIKQRQLQGDNKILIDRLELGERVESPAATDLPLDLAIALLSDSDGRIDLGLPISGSLDDPQFSYGQIVWKAVTNILSSIVTAPFRALGALFGGGGEKLDSVAFEAGASQLTPPEREKLVRLATILNKRPGLALDVHGAWAESDRGVLQDRQARRAVAAKGGQTIGENGDPGPLSTRTPKIQAALEALFADRFGDDELSVLKDGFRSANPGQLKESLTGQIVSGLSGLLKKKRSLSETEIAQLKGADFHALLFEKLRAREQVKDEALQALAARRAEHVLEKLKAAGAPEARIRQGAVEKSEKEGRDIPLKFEVGRAAS
ncbi:MAG: DUF748 domain-containing protein [Sulfuritalea sp.]|nr:DUF748 domain-containing protein [Sulfuritalea sp.]